MMIKSGVGLVIAGLACGLFCLGAGWLALRLIRGNRAAVVASLPLLSDQTVAVDVSGELVVSIEVPRLATEFRTWEFEVVEEQTKRSHVMKYGGPRSTGTVKGFSTIKIPIGRLALERPENLAVRVKGLMSGGDYTAYHIILARPHLARMVLQIVGLVLCGVGMLLSLIWGLWQLGIVKAS